MGGLPDNKKRRPGQRAKGSIESEGECNQRFRIDLMGVRSAEAGKLRPGDMLAVTLRNEGTMTAVVCETVDTAVVGALSAFPGLADLISCLERGFAYQALVEKASPVACTVYVSRSQR